MKTYKETSKYKLYLGDVLEVLKAIPDDSIDMIFTSPPYNLNLSKSKGDFKLEYDNYDDNMEWCEYKDWQVEVLNECYRVLNNDGQLFYNHKDKYKEKKFKCPFDIIKKSKFKIRQDIIWYRKNCFNFSTGGFGDMYEHIYWLYKDTPIKIDTNHSVLGDVWEINIEKNNKHPAPFPLELPLRAIYSMYGNNEGKTILDIFNGSGTTGVATLLLNHNYIGIDISKKYLKMSEKRLENYMNESLLGQKEIDKHQVKQGYRSPKKVTNQSSIFDFIDNTLDSKQECK